ncbi:MAG: hypothetical protein ACRD96_07715 [Bryobacteraceae bacterium]
MPDPDSYDRTLFDALTTTCLLPLCVTASGADQELCSSRSARHSSLPVRLSRASMCEPSSWSNFRYSVSPSSTVAAPSPNWSRIFIGGNSFFHPGLPLRSY